MFYDKYIELCTRINKKPSAVAQEIGFNKASVTGWKKGSTPTDSNMQKIASYFEVPVSDFLDAEEKTASADVPDSGTISEDDIKAAFFNGADPAMTKEEQDAMWEDAQEYFRFKMAQRRQKQKDEK